MTPVSLSLGQTYFAVQTRRQELQDEANFANLSEDNRRLMLRRETISVSKSRIIDIMLNCLRT